MRDRCTTLSFLLHFLVCVCVVIVHLLYHLFMQPSSFLCAHKSFYFLLDSLVPSLPPSLCSFTGSQDLSALFSPHLWWQSSFSPLPTPCFLSFILQWPLCPVLWKLAFLSFIHPSISQKRVSFFPFSFHKSLNAPFSPHSAEGFLWKMHMLDVRGAHVFVQCVCMYVCACLWLCVGMSGYWGRGGWVGVSALLASSCGSLTPDARLYTAPPL